MVLLQSELVDGRITRAELETHLEPHIVDNVDMISALSARDMQMFVTPFLINVSHINSCLQRTMIKQWKNGFSEAKHAAAADLPFTTGLTTQRLMQIEKRRLAFVHQYRTAYFSVCRAAKNLENLADAQTRAWNRQGPRQRVKSILALQESLLMHFEAASDLVLRLLPGDTFLKVYNQEEAPLMTQHSTSSVLLAQ